ncbi:LIC_13387 family protein [Streptomyces sp. 5.8]|uniref:LIC_13387 family protein n=1 Tax=Streptomyces sp. 5.8 TaxID=3406571 RepID=UPI003BB695FA
MSATAPSVLRHKPAPLGPFKVGVGGFFFLGTGHLSLAAAEAWGDPTPQQEASSAAMRATSMTLLGLERTTLEVVHGMSSVMGLFVISCALLALFAARHSPALIERRTAFGWTLLAASLVGLALSALFLPPPPIVVLAVTSCAFALSLRRAAP